MIPILFDKKTTQFATNGIGRLVDIIEGSVENEGNGVFDLYFQYPIDGHFFANIKNGNFVVADVSPTKKRQIFEIYQVVKEINGRVGVYAHHVSYRQSFVPVKPFQADGITNTINGLNENAMEANPFTFTTDLTNEDSSYVQNVPKSLRACLGGSEGSILDTFSGSSGIEYIFDNFNTFITLNAGRDNGVFLRYGKNITDLEQEENIENVVTGVLPYWQSQDRTIVVYGSIQYSQAVTNYGYHRTELLDLSDQFETAPSELDLNQAGLNYITRASGPNTNIRIKFIEAPKYFENVGVFESVDLWDVVHVVYAPLNITFDSKVIKTTYDFIRERYTEIEIGDKKSNIASTIAANVGDISKLNLANNRLISITQTIDEEIGQIKSNVASVEGSLRETQEGLTETIRTQATEISQETASVQIRAFSQEVDKSIEGIEKRVESLETTVEVSTAGLTIKQNNEGSYFLITDTSAQVYVDGILSAKFGDGGTLSDEYTLDNAWHLDTVNNEETFILYYAKKVN